MHTALLMIVHPTRTEFKNTLNIVGRTSFFSQAHYEYRGMSPLLKREFFLS
jgi:hypothetical protein